MRGRIKHWVPIIAGALALTFAGMVMTLATPVTVHAATGDQGATADPTLWFLTRGAASSAYLVLIVTTILGIGISTQAFDSVTQRWRVLDLHQVLTLLMWGLIALHLVTLAVDPYLTFGVIHLFWPFGELHRPVPVALGVIGFYALAIVSLSSWVRGAIPYRWWRAMHYVSTVAFVGVTLHGMLSGTDSNTIWMVATYVTSTTAVGFLLILRLTQAVARSRPRVVK